MRAEQPAAIASDSTACYSHPAAPLLLNPTPPISHAHPQVVHRDIKPANVLLSGTGAATVAKLCDFGFAREVSSSRPEAQERLSSYVVTRWYRAPEILVGDRYGMAADVSTAACTCVTRTCGGQQGCRQSLFVSSAV